MNCVYAPDFLLSQLTICDLCMSPPVYKMLDYALDYTTCRKLLFDNYFGNPASVVAPFSSSDRSPCGHCDNCRRGASAAASAGGLTVTTRTVTDEAWKVCKIVQAMHRKMGRVTLPQACDLVRGLAKATFGTRDGEGKAGKDSLDLGEVCGGKVTLNKDVSRPTSPLSVLFDKVQLLLGCKPTDPFCLDLT